MKHAVPLSQQPIGILQRFHWLLVVAMFSNFVVGTLSAAEGYWSDIATQIVEEVDRAESLHHSADPKGARRAVIQAYFGLFEETKMEAAMRMELGSKHTYKVERQFGKLRQAIKKKSANSEVAAIATRLREAIQRDAALLDQAGIKPEVFRVNQ